MAIGKMTVRRRKGFRHRRNAGRRVTFTKQTTLGGNHPLGRNLKVNFKYSDVIVRAPTIEDNYAFSCNNLFDPDTTGTGHQPLGYDQIMVLYKHYLVIGASITYNIINTSTTVPFFFVAGITRIATTFTGGVDDFLEQSSAKVYTLGIQGSGKETATIRLNVSPNKWLGIPNPMSDDRLWGQDTASPAEQCKFSWYAISVNGSSDPAYTVVVKLNYVAILREPQTDIAQS